MRDLLLHPGLLGLLFHVGLSLAVTLRVVMLRLPSSTSLAWCLLAWTLPVAGGLLYWTLGERRLGPARARRLGELAPAYVALLAEGVRSGATDVDWSAHRPEAEAFDRTARGMLSLPAVRGAHLRLHDDSHEILGAIAADVDAARESVQLEFYIWGAGGGADDVVEATLRAARRGVRCRVLVDAQGSKAWLRGRDPARLREAGASVAAARPMRNLFDRIGRTDLRYHRKIVVVDGHVGWTGSMNLVDPAHFKQDAGVGRWVDSMARIQGPPCRLLSAIAATDWYVETGEPIAEVRRTTGWVAPAPEGSADLLVLPSGPGTSSDAIVQLVLQLLYAARREIVVTTPYFVPDESIQRALRGAATRGVAVHLIIPARVDSLLVRHASRSFYEELLAAGAHLHAFDGGLLHTKSIVVDGELAMFGTANLDIRSLYLNFEVSLFVFDVAFATELRALQQRYLASSTPIDAEAWARRGVGPRLVEGLARLASPML